MSKIESNTSIIEIREQVNGMKKLLRDKKLLNELGITPIQRVKLSSQYKKLETKLNELSTLPDRFNDTFKGTGWIAYESLNVELMEKSIEISKEEGVSAGEELLTKFYIDKEKTNYLFIKAKVNLRERATLFELAVEDHFNQRYYSSIPLFLMIIDGFVNKEEATGFFTESTNLIAWDSIAGHRTGIKEVSKLMSSMRRKTNTEEINLPYRNGILHGRDLNYANPIVSSKSLGVIFALIDWQEAKRKMKAGATTESYAPPSIEEILSSLTRLDDSRAKLKQQDALLAEWKKRDIEIGVSAKASGVIEDYEEGSPERCLVEVFTLINSQNYGHLSSKIYWFSPDESLKKRAGELREIYEKFRINDFELLEIEDKAPAVTEIRAKIDLQIENVEISREDKFRLIFSDDSRDILVRGSEEGEWRILDNFSTQWGFLKIETE